MKDKFHDRREFDRTFTPLPCVICTASTYTVHRLFELPLHVGDCFKMYSVTYWHDELKTDLFTLPIPTWFFVDIENGYRGVW